MNIITTTAENGVQDAAAYIIKLIQSQSQPVLLLLSGGSSLNIPHFLSSDTFTTPVTVILGDDRFSRKEDENSFCILSKTNFVKNNTQPTTTFISTTPKEGESLDEFGKRYEQAITDWQNSNPTGVVIALFGVGEDGHLAGMMPFTEKDEWEKLFLSTHNVIAYDAGTRNPYPLRATITGSFIQQSITHAVAFALGAKKEPVLQRLVHDTLPYHTMPAQLLKSIPHCTLITDCVI